METGTRELLMIAYFFPPGADVGIYRTLKFAKYLRGLGWRPVVVTQSNGKFHEFREGTLDLIPEGVEVHRTWSFELLNEGRNRGGSDGAGRRTLASRIHKRLCHWWRYLTVPDNRVFWAFTAARRARRLVRERGIRHVYVSGKPFSSFLAGCYVKRTEGVRLVIDYRDPWTQNITYFRRSPVHVWIDRRLERWAIRRADLVIANTRHNESRGQTRDRELRRRQGRRPQRRGDPIEEVVEGGQGVVTLGRSRWSTARVHEPHSVGQASDSRSSRSC